MAQRRKRKSRTHAPACVFFGQTKNAEGRTQLCVWAECQYAGGRVGPIFSHTDAAVRRALATLTSLCPCGRPYHRTRYTEGRRIVTPAGRRPTP